MKVTEEKTNLLTNASSIVKNTDAIEKKKNTDSDLFHYQPQVRLLHNIVLSYDQRYKWQVVYKGGLTPK